MTLFRDPKSWNFGLGENYLDYIRRRSVAADITGDIAQIQRASAREIAGMVSDQTRAILLGMDALKHRASDQTIVVKTESAPVAYDHSREIDLLCQCFGQGVSVISSGLDNVSRGISDLNSTFQWGFSEILGSLGGIQDTLDKLLKVAKKPSKNYSYEKFDDARDAFRQKLYPECLKLLDRAINGDHVSSGYVLEWRFHLLKGVIQLGSASIPEEFINLKEAEDAFLLAARYARADSPHEAAKAMMQAGWAAFAQQKLAEARKHTDQALALNPNLGEALYNAAKFAMAEKDLEKGLGHLSKAIDLDAGYVAKADTDGDFQLYRTKLHDLFEGKRQELLRKIPSKQRARWNLPILKSEQELNELGLLALLGYENASKSIIEKRLEAEKNTFEVVVDCGFGKKESFKVCLVHPGKKGYRTKKVESLFAALGLSHAESKHLFALGSKHPELQMKFCIVALGSKSRVNGGLVAPYIGYYVAGTVISGYPKKPTSGTRSAEPDYEFDWDDRFLALLG